MRLFSGSSADFIALCANNQIANHLEEVFFDTFGSKPSYSEIKSWKNSLPCLARILENAELTDQGMMLEYKLPLSAKRVDVLICGLDVNQKRHAVLIELKQWEDCTLTDYDSEYVVTCIGRRDQFVLHPSIQVGNYRHYLKNNSAVFYNGKDPIQLSACCYLHNYNLLEGDVLIDQRFDEAINKFPIYTAGKESNLTSFITDRVGGGNGMQILAEIEQSKLCPSQKVLQQVSKVIKQKLLGSKDLELFGRYKAKGDYILLDEQLIIHDLIMKLDLDKTAGKHAVIVNGGAGTGKSVIALQLLADLKAANRKKSDFQAQYATGSNAFTETLRKIIGKESVSVFRYFMSYSKAESNSLDVLLLDEAHRIRERTVEPGIPTGRLQIQDLLDAARISVFFIDDHQVVRPDEIGSSRFIREQAEAAGCTVYEFNLKANFRNGGSERYSDWIDNMLHIRETPHSDWIDELHFKFEIMDSPEDVDRMIKGHVKREATGRITAGFCWPWTKYKLDAQEELIKDIKIGDYHRPWNAYKSLRSQLRKEIPISTYWAYEGGGIEQIGCIYTVQGFEFDYIGVIFGKDLRYNPDKSEWEGFPECNYDGLVKNSDDFLRLVKNTYRVLLGRGMKACYVYFMDKDTERYFRSRIRRN